MSEDTIALALGHTDEASASAGGPSRFYSPFSALYNPEAADAIADAEMAQALQGRVRRNPPLTAAERKELTAYQHTDSAVQMPNTNLLGIAGLIVKKDWDGALDLCRAVYRHIVKDDSAPARAVYDWRYFLTVTMDYLESLVAGQEPTRRALTKGEQRKGKRVSLWDDVKRCCLAEQGNIKLPFAAYSEMPVVTCPGAGGVASKYIYAENGVRTTPRMLGAAQDADTGTPRQEGCATFCYSLKALRNPSVAGRLVTLTLGMSVNPKVHVGVVIERMIKLAGRKSKKKGQTKILRLFVDGDFRDENAIVLWMEGVKELAKHGVMVYGYSKSWNEFLNVHKDKYVWPKNYALNLSSGSKYFDDPAMLEKMRQIPVVRGRFIAVDPLERLVKKAAGEDVGAGVWKFYQKMVNDIARDRSLSDGKRRDRLKDLERQLVSDLAAHDPEIVERYNEYVSTVHDLEERGGVLLQRLKDVPGIGAVVAGPVAQASTWAFITATMNRKKEFACPISCGDCPKTAIPQHEKLLRALRVDDTAFLQDYDYAAARAAQVASLKGMAELAAKKTGFGAIHACGNRSNKQDIVIGIH